MNIDVGPNVSDQNNQAYLDFSAPDPGGMPDVGQAFDVNYQANKRRRCDMVNSMSTFTDADRVVSHRILHQLEHADLVVAAASGGGIGPGEDIAGLLPPPWAANLMLQMNHLEQHINERFDRIEDRLEITERFLRDNINKSRNASAQADIRK